MAGYTRQSIADIINGSDVTAPPLNAEFNQLASAFNGATGHLHDGSSGNAPKINLTTSVAGYLPAVHGGTGGKNNVTATTNPTTTDDAGDGYAPGSIWENTTTGRVFICVGNTNNAAVWRELVQVQTGNKIIPETTNTVDLGDPATRFQDLWLSGGIGAAGNVSIGGTLNASDFNASGNATIGGTLSVTGTATLAQIDANSGTIDNTVIGSNTASPITGTTITSTNGFTGDITGDVTGNVTASTGTSSFNNISASGTITGAVSGNVSGNVTSSGTSTFNNVTISGTLNMDGSTSATIQNLTDPVNPQDAATRNYVETRISNVLDTAPAALDTLNELAASLNDDADFAGTMTTALAGKVADTGDTMTGDLIMSGATVTGLPLPTANTEAASKQYADQQDALKVSKSGDTMSGNLAMGGNNITGLAAPTADDHATSKQYVDGILGSGTAASASAAAAATSAANAAISETNAAASATTASQGASVSQQVLDLYSVGATQPQTATVGDLWFDTTTDTLRVLTTSGWEETATSIGGIKENFYYTATANQLSFSGADDNGNTLVVDSAGLVNVYMNGIRLHEDDYTASAGGNIVALNTGVAAGDLIYIEVFGALSATNLHDYIGQGLSPTNSPTFAGLTISGDLEVSGGTIKLDGNYPVGSNNVTLGKAALQYNTSGYNNTAVGPYALNSNTSGYNNTAVGKGTLYSNTTGGSNTAIGRESLYSNTTGSGNIAIGSRVLWNNTVGRFNTALGVAALHSNTTGLYNTAIGPSALYSNTTGIQSTAIGPSALNSNTTGVDNTAIGPYALYSNTTGRYNNAIGRYALYSNTTGHYNTAIGSDALRNNTVGRFNTAIGGYTGNQYGLDIRASDNNIVLSDGVGYPRLHIDGSGVTTLRRNASAGDALVFNYGDSTSVGSVSVTSSGTTYNTTSDRRLKTDIQPIANGTEKLMAMNPVTHKWKADPHTGETVVGFIAQEMQEIVPEAVSGTPDGEEMMSMDYGRITPVLVAALQDAHKKIEALEERLAELETK